jgi:hypothetical protein
VPGKRIPVYATEVDKYGHKVSWYHPEVSESARSTLTIPYQNVKHASLVGMGIGQKARQGHHAYSVTLSSRKRLSASKHVSDPSGHEILEGKIVSQMLINSRTDLRSLHYCPAN